MSRQTTQEIKMADRSDSSLNHETVEAMAYQIWLERGRPIGSDQEDWYRAEAELKGKSRVNQRAA